MGFKEELLAKRLGAVVDAEASKADFDAAEVEKVRGAAQKALGERRIKRFEDLRNFVHAKFDEISKQKGTTNY